MNEEVTAKELREKFDGKLKELQESCPHEETEWMPYEWAIGHYWEDVRICRRCEKIVERREPEITGTANFPMGVKWTTTAWDGEKMVITK